MKSMMRILAGAAGVAFVGVAGVGNAAVTFAQAGNVLTVTASADGDTVLIEKVGNQVQVNGTNAGPTNGMPAGRVTSVIVNDTSVGGGVDLTVTEATLPLDSGAAIPVTFNASDGDDSFSYIPGAGLVGNVQLTMNGGAGTDSFSTQANAGGAKGINITGANAGSITGVGIGQSFTGTEDVDFDDNSNGSTVTVTDGTAAANTMTVEPSSSTAVGVGVSGVIVHLIDITATPSVAGGGQAGDQLTFFGRDAVQDAIAISNTNITVTGLLGANYSGFPAVLVNGGDEAGNVGDTITVAAGTTQTLSVDGGTPGVGGANSLPNAQAGDSLITNGATVTNVNVQCETVDGLLVPVTVSGAEIE